MSDIQMTAPGAGMSLGDSVYDRLLRERIIFLGTEVDDEIANKLCAQILLLSAEDPTRDISLYINSPGGSVTAGMAIYDTMQYSPCDIATYGMGLAASMGQFLLSAGTCRQARLSSRSPRSRSAFKKTLTSLASSSPTLKCPPSTGWTGARKAAAARTPTTSTNPVTVLNHAV